uniref:Skp1_POZ domain-containing protein n=1 Tax=Steinernema glaseri TaxID=37863 RepID=A0A1I7XWV8_9BILA
MKRVAEKEDYLLYLVSEEGERLPVMRSLMLEQSVTVRNCLMMTKQGDNMIPIDKYSSHTLRLVIRWCEQHESCKVPETAREILDHTFSVQLTPEEHALLGGDIVELKNLYEAAQYLEIMTLANAVARVAADQIGKCASSEEMRTLLANFVDTLVTRDEAEEEGNAE